MKHYLLVKRVGAREQNLYWGAKLSFLCSCEP